jgi:hypothetical protein
MHWVLCRHCRRSRKHADFIDFSTHFDPFLFRMLGDEGGDPSFVCERVCTSNRLMRRMGSLAKVRSSSLRNCFRKNHRNLSPQPPSPSSSPSQDVTTDTCVTVCGTSSEDACIEACQKAVCSNMHQVPAWNEGCLSRCTAECRRKR